MTMQSQHKTMAYGVEFRLTLKDEHKIKRKHEFASLSPYSKFQNLCVVQYLRSSLSPSILDLWQWYNISLISDSIGLTFPASNTVP